MFFLGPLLYILGCGAAGAVGGYAIGYTVGYVLASLIDDDSIREQVQRDDKFKDAVKALILSKKTKVVNVGLFDEADDKLGEMELKSEKGISSNLREGQCIYL